MTEERRPGRFPARVWPAMALLLSFASPAAADSLPFAGLFGDADGCFRHADPSAYVEGGISA